MFFKPKSRPESESPQAGEGTTIVLVGHCLPDKFMLKSALGRFVPGAEIVVANDTKTLDPHLSAGNVLLVNRVLDGRFETNSGIELIAEVAKRDDAAATILLSNYAEAQAEAVAAGALPGFGKSDLYAEETGRILVEAAGGST